ncbi:hypothetical protein [Streptomyces sp. OM5714]|uniref:hypothetical protein n=1 Tax=Streptomyces sp. OM5714 TaxID=2602736 RepID=UPI0013DC15B8|nr:hypothetical protein [Streptomyces sp. OM5714]
MNWKDDMEYRRAAVMQMLIGEYYNSQSIGRAREWESQQVDMHERIYAQYNRKIAAMPSYEQPILLVTAGAGGVGKTTALNAYLDRLKEPHSAQFGELKEFGGIAAEGLQGDSFLAMSHNDIKREMCANGAVDYIVNEYRREIERKFDERIGGQPGENGKVFERPDMLSCGIHRESSWVMDKIAYECLKQKKNLVYDVALTDVKRVMGGEHKGGLFDSARQFGYRVIALTVEGSQDQAMDGNYQNYLTGAIRLRGGDAYGVTVNPVNAIKFAYRNGSAESVCRENVRKIAAAGLIHRVIEAKFETSIEAKYETSSDMRLQDPMNSEAHRQRDVASPATSPVTDRRALFQEDVERHTRRTPSPSPSASNPGHQNPAKSPVTGRGR